MTETTDIGTDEMPKPLMRGVTSNPTMGALIFEFERENADERYAKWAGTDEGFERVLGFFIPPFQRPAVWTAEQNVAFIENAWRGIHLGTYVVNKKDEFAQRTQRWNRLDRWLIDGQQRLRAVQSYLRSEFPVFGRTWGELSELEHRRFDTLEFAKTIVSESDEGQLRFLYDCLNFGGTRHTEDQRACDAPVGDPHAVSDVFGLERAYSGIVRDLDVSIARKPDGAWGVSFAVPEAFHGGDDIHVEAADEAAALVVFRAFRDCGTLPDVRRAGEASP